ncbi:MAG TPA: hypothetical protein VLH38_01535 [Patescibacteria group bacterium]|nr:hypothetical protein [Patescibacteria group bacterium]
MAGTMLHALKHAGYTIINDPYKADVVIAHSGGCFLVPKDLPAKQIIMIGLTYWPHKSILRALFEKNWNDFHFHRRSRNARHWLRKFIWNTIYFWNWPHNIRMLRARKRGEFWHLKRLTLIRNEEDSFCTPDIANIPFTHKPDFIELPDQHDDCWLHPKHYIAVIQY